MWSSAPSPLLSGTKARAVSSPAKIADLPASMPGVLLPSARATVAPAAKASAEHRTAANSNTYYVTCIVCSVVLVLLVLINNPIKVPSRPSQTPSQYPRSAPWTTATQTTASAREVPQLSRRHLLL